MKNIKVAVLALGILGLLGCVLPFINLGPELKMSILSLAGKGGGIQVYAVMAGFGAAIFAGVIGMTKGFLKPQAIIATVGFAATFGVFRQHSFDLLKAPFGLGAKLIFISALVGLVASIIAITQSKDA